MTGSNGNGNSELLAHERAALALWLLQQRPYSSRELAERLGLSIRGTRYLLNAISRVTPVFCHNGLWQVCQDT